MKAAGYMLVKHASRVIARYMDCMSTGPFAKNLPHLRSLRIAIPFLDPEKYRGISRNPLQPHPSLDSEIVQAFIDTGCDIRGDSAARRRFREILGETDPDFDDDDIVEHPLQARELLRLVDCPSEYEIIRVRRRDFDASPNILGFDIGYWSGDHFSLIGDSFVTPTWHPPQPEVFVELGERLKPLNQHLLFKTPEEAALFKQWYKSQSWAEIESEGEFDIIQVDEVLK